MTYAIKRNDTALTEAVVDAFGLIYRFWQSGPRPRSDEKSRNTSKKKR